jgi:hypothetical protein
LNSVPKADTQGNLHPMRFLYASISVSGARDTAVSVTS